MTDDYPVIHVNYANSSLVVSQDSDHSNKTYVIPVEVVDDARKITKIVLNDTQIAIHRPAAYVVAQPNTYARHIYNVSLQFLNNDLAQWRAGLSSLVQIH